MENEDFLQRAVKYVTDTLNNNQELYLAQIIKMNPKINLLNYTLCKMPCYEEDGKFYEKIWLEEIK
jgi:hypothetical protein